jgi:hypothetical protein
VAIFGARDQGAVEVTVVVDWRRGAAVHVVEWLGVVGGVHVVVQPAVCECPAVKNWVGSVGAVHGVHCGVVVCGGVVEL